MSEKSEMFPAPSESSYPNYLADSDTHPFSETKDYDTRQARYRGLTYRAKHELQLILEQPDALDDTAAVSHLLALRDALNRINLEQAFSRAEAIDERHQQKERPEELH